MTQKIIYTFLYCLCHDKIHRYNNQQIVLPTDFKRNVRAAPIRAVDVYNLMCRTLGILPLPNNGSWSRVEYLLSGSVGLAWPSPLWALGLLVLVLSLQA